ncbi:CRISPR-associated Cse2 family protein [Alcanivorax sp. S71-1-4]|uniref:type I-E CRISPR-associated protein Cse2/CasB n=1 Tax=Alcanivorax sp. S71-1-4 TaxID=1177159 RepID=UPI00135C647A|nr:type I-E CRISPR-associated protein Cse2/CasB [Alcanivorax sp. S71-1-4]KAF0805181.1 CRISPR-associated Cse2 family protein [Alcanivorax sp. S71-1-4]
MSEHAERFIEYLKTLKEKDRGAMATLRHSLAFEPGAYPKAFPYVERFAGSSLHERDARRLALYAVAGLFARHPMQRPQRFAASLGELMRGRESPSIEQRFVALLGADAENIMEYLRQAVSLLAADSIGFDYARLLDDLTIWMDLGPAMDPTRRDHLRQRWARDFYRALQAETEPKTTIAE